MPLRATGVKIKVVAAFGCHVVFGMAMNIFIGIYILISQSMQRNCKSDSAKERK